MTYDELKRFWEAMRQENAATHAETRRHFDVTVERLERRFDMLAEGVTSVDEKLDRRAADLEERMERGFAETQASAARTPRHLHALTAATFT